MRGKGGMYGKGGHACMEEECKRAICILLECFLIVLDYFVCLVVLVVFTYGFCLSLIFKTKEIIVYFSHKIPVFLFFVQI